MLKWLSSLAIRVMPRCGVNVLDTILGQIREMVIAHNTHQVYVQLQKKKSTRRKRELFQSFLLCSGRKSLCFLDSN